MTPATGTSKAKYPAAFHPNLYHGNVWSVDSGRKENPSGRNDKNFKSASMRWCKRLC